SDTRGLADAIADDRLTLPEVVRHLPRFNLSVLPAGRSPASPYEALHSSRLDELLEEARSHYAYVVVDTPPVVPVPDCRLIARLVDAFLVLVGAHRTRRELLQEALAALDSTKILGLVFNGDDRPRGGDERHRAGGSSEPARAAGLPSMEQGDCDSAPAAAPRSAGGDNSLRCRARPRRSGRQERADDRGTKAPKRCPASLPTISPGAG